MITIYRRHLKNCPQTSRRYRRCQCPFHGRAGRSGGPGEEFTVERIDRGEYRLVGGHFRGKRRTRLEAWFDAGGANIVSLPWEAETGLRWAELLATLRASDADFAKAGVETTDPFAA